MIKFLSYTNLILNQISRLRSINNGKKLQWRKMSNKFLKKFPFLLILTKKRNYLLLHCKKKIFNKIFYLVLQFNHDHTPILPIDIFPNIPSYETLGSFRVGVPFSKGLKRNDIDVDGSVYW